MEKAGGIPMRMIKKSINFFSIFSKNLTYITIGSLFIHFIVMIVNLYITQTGNIVFNTELFNIIFSGNMYPIVMAYGILIFITLSLYQKLIELFKQNRNLKNENENYKNVIISMQNISGIVLQEISESNNQILRWVKRKEEKGTPPISISSAANNIGNALESLSYSLFVHPYAQTIPVKAEYRHIEK
jgi:hypothetical protein